jgi:peroxiredoxin Q/BCP
MRVSPILLFLAGVIAPLAAQQSKPGSSPTLVLVSGPQVGHTAPDFTLDWADKDGIGPVENPYQLWKDRGKTVVLAFYPKDFTSGCTAQMQTFADQYDTLFGRDVIVVGINADSLDSHHRFAAKLGLPFRLLSDPELKVARTYGSYDSSGRPRRTIFVVAPDGRVHYRNSKFNPMDPKDYSALGAAVREARGS